MSENPLPAPSGSDTRQDHASRGMWWFFGMIVLVVFYVLSCGPALYFRERGIIPQKVISIVYKPLSVAQHWPVPGRYFEWWMKKGREQ
jgi:hypothetical protein